MSRQFPDWLSAFCDYAGYMEAPRRMHFWAGVSAIAGALRRKVWFDQIRFRWFPNFYVIFVAPPGIVAKSTTADVSINLLRSVPGINFGPDVITWQALATRFANAREEISVNGDLLGEKLVMSAITCCSTELGNLLNPKDPELVSLLITLWDGRKQYEKETKMSGNDYVEAPWLNVIGCTTPHWIADNVPESMIGGGLTSRMVFVYAEEKAKEVPYLDEVIPKTDPEVERALIADLEYISLHLCGGYSLTAGARLWGREWYHRILHDRAPGLDDDRFDGYISRKQALLHKLAMILSAAKRDELVIDEEDFVVADTMIRDVEPDMPKVFSRIGRSLQANQTERLIAFIRRRGAVDYAEAYRFVHSYFPDVHDFEGVVSGAIKAGYIDLDTRGEKPLLVWLNSR